MDLLERAEFFKQLEETLAEVARGQGRLVLVSGEAGIGKTSLVEQFVEKQKNQYPVLWGGCDALFTPRPLGPIYDLALQVRGDLFTLLEQEAPRATIFSAVFAELQNQPATLLVFEDVHWADEGTLDLLKFIGRRINKLNSLLRITYHDDEVQADHPLRMVLGDSPRSSVRRVRLPRSCEAAVQELAKRAGKRIDDLYAIRGGNPFFVTEALASEDSGVPVAGSDAMLSHLARLTPAARAVVELISDVPTKADHRLLNDSLKLASSALEESIAAGILLLD